VHRYLKVTTNTIIPLSLSNQYSLPDNTLFGGSSNSGMWENLVAWLYRSNIWHNRLRQVCRKCITEVTAKFPSPIQLRTPVYWSRHTNRSSG